MHTCKPAKDVAYAAYFPSDVAWPPLSVDILYKVTSTCTLAISPRLREELDLGGADPRHAQGLLAEMGDEALGGAGALDESQRKYSQDDSEQDRSQ